MKLESEIRAFNEDLWKKLPKSRISVIMEAKYVNMHREWATYTNPYIANSKKKPVKMEDLLNAHKYQSDHIIPLAYIERLPGLSWSITNWIAFFYDLDTQVVIPQYMNASKSYRGPLNYCPPFGIITGGSDLINHYKKASPAKKIVVENYCFTWKHIAKKWDIYKYLDSGTKKIPGTKKIISQILKEAKIAGRSPQLINPHR